MIRGKAAYIERLTKRMRFRSVSVGERLDGSSPPSVFIGRWNYPKVFVGPLVPPTHGNTAIMDLPEEWIGSKEAADIINFRLQLVRGKEAVHIKKGIEVNRTINMIREIALAKNSVDVEVEFSKLPRGRFFNEDVQPFGPSAPMKEVSVNAEKFEPNMEKAFYDTDLLSRDAVISLYEKGLAVSSLQKALSVGAFGLQKNRRLVPTRWSITAVDDMLGKNLLQQVKFLPIIDEYRVYETEHLNNKFIVVLTPTLWQYETMEAFFPQIIGDRLEIYGDSEGYEGKKNYALIGGCYYSAKLAVLEHLTKLKRQAGAIVLRECYEDYMPLGVWNVRENMREAMTKPHQKFETMRQATDYAASRLRVPMTMWKRKSKLLTNRYSTKTLNFFLKNSQTAI